MKRGYMDWDQALLPPQTLLQRRDALARQLQLEGLDAAVVYGDVNAADELIDYANYGPYWCNTVAIITADGRYHLVTGHNARVNPWICRITGVEESQITPAGMRVPVKTAEVMTQLLGKTGKVGIIGKYTLADSFKALEKAGFEVVWLTGYSDGLLNIRDASYLAIVTKGHAIMEQALLGALDRCDAGASIKRICAEIEYALRSSGAMDVQLLAAAEGCAFTLPWDERRDHWNLYVNVQYLGQWLVLAAPVGADRTPLIAAMDKVATSLKKGDAPKAALEGFDIEVKTRVMSDQFSSLNVNGSFLAPNQIFSISALDRATGFYSQKMYILKETGAEALGTL